MPPEKPEAGLVGFERLLMFSALLTALWAPVQFGTSSSGSPTDALAAVSVC